MRRSDAGRVRAGVCAGVAGRACVGGGAAGRERRDGGGDASSTGSNTRPRPRPGSMRERRLPRSVPGGAIGVGTRGRGGSVFSDS